MAAAPDSDFIALQEALAGEYSLDRELGRGGMGIVYLARDVRLARPVAIKVLPPEVASNATWRTAFLNESQTVARLSHPNIVPVYLAGERGGFTYLVMAFVDGVTLGERIRTRGPLLPGQAARVLREVAWALAYAHTAGIVHRDVSAENIMLERGTERAIVMDFGIASAMRTAAVHDDGRVMGNAHYLSPEQAAGEPLDARSDLYSLGIAGFYALTGRLPFDGETAADVVRQQLTATAPSIASVTPSVPPRLAAAVERCLHKEPIRRYRSAESFAEAIDLAFEHAKEIPAPLRSWIAQNERELPAAFAMLGMGATAGITLVAVTNLTWPFFVPFTVMPIISAIPWTTRLRRIIGEGYTPDDLHAALREHQLVRAEELEYERRQTSPRSRTVFRTLLGASIGGTAMGGWMYYQASVFANRLLPSQSGNGIWDTATAVALGRPQSLLVLFPSLVLLTISGVPLAGEFIRFRLASRIANASISFWKGRWGRRIAKLASLGETPATRPALGMPVLTEVALGRATDHLFEALPRDTRRELSALPEAVRQLSEDATRIRESIDAIDDQLAGFERGGESLKDARRDAIAAELRESRSQSALRLAQTVGAIENIRLDLLRLHMGSAGIESVTASLEAALDVARQIDGMIDATTTIDSLIAETADPPSNEVFEDDDSDTPVDGVPAARA